eukprot:9478332-Pyramimonas_sp.AAC.1
MSQQSPAKIPGRSGQVPGRSRPGSCRLPRALQERFKWPSGELKMVRQGRREIPDARDCLQTAQRAFKTPQEASTWAEILDFLLVSDGFGRSRLFGLQALQGGPRGAQNLPKTAHEASKRAP